MQWAVLAVMTATFLILAFGCSRGPDHGPRYQRCVPDFRQRPPQPPPQYRLHEIVHREPKARAA